MRIKQTLMKWNFFSKTQGPKRNRVAIRVPFDIHDEGFNAQHKALESMLGKMSDIVSHALMPFETDMPEMPGYLDLYYFENFIKETCLATMELNVNNRALQNKLGLYDLVACTPLKIDLNEEANSEYNRTEDRIRLILTEIGRHSDKNVFENESIIRLTVESDDTFVVLSHFRSSMLNGAPYNLMLYMEINEKEFDFASEHGSYELIEKMKAKKIYPYSINTRKCVI